MTVLKSLRYLQSRKYRGTIIVIGDNAKNDAMFFVRSCVFDRVVAVDGNVPGTNLHNIRDQDKGAPIEFLSTFVSNRPGLFLNTSSNAGKWFLTEVPVGPNSTGVSALTLDEVCTNIGCISVIKIDADAHELEILESGSETLRRHRPDLCVKTSHNVHITKLLERYGYLQGTVLSDSIIYLVHVGWLPVAILRALTASPFWVSSRCVWRWKRIASGMAMTRRRWLWRWWWCGTKQMTQVGTPAVTNIP